jgi:uncharacterized protein (DUF305 family)
LEVPILYFASEQEKFMSTTRVGSVRSDVPIAFLAAIAFGLLLAFMPADFVAAQDATPTPSSCEDVMPMASTPAADHAMGDMEMGEMGEFDLAYIDMMIPHHQSIIALAEVATPELRDPRLVELAGAIIDTQAEEIDELMAFRDEWYPDAEPVSMDMMMMAMPSMDMSATPSMGQLMDSEWIVMAFCAAEDMDLAFIKLTIPHHQMAIDASEDALELAVNQELVAVAEEVIEAQQEEIDLLMEIQAEITGEATPAS